MLQCLFFVCQCNDILGLIKRTCKHLTLNLDNLKVHPVCLRWVSSPRLFNLKFNSKNVSQHNTCESVIFHTENRTINVLLQDYAQCRFDAYFKQKKLFA